MNAYILLDKMCRQHAEISLQAGAIATKDDASLLVIILIVILHRIAVMGLSISACICSIHDIVKFPKY